MDPYALGFICVTNGSHQLAGPKTNARIPHGRFQNRVKASSPLLMCRKLRGLVHVSKKGWQMSKRATDFLRDWTHEYVNATSYDDTSEAKRLAAGCLEAAKVAGISPKELSAEVGDLGDYMLSVLNDRADDEVKRLSSKD